jgi:hypothetical protein
MYLSCKETARRHSPADAGWFWGHDLGGCGGVFPRPGEAPEAATTRASAVARPAADVGTAEAEGHAIPHGHVGLINCLLRSKHITDRYRNLRRAS